jgi:hypothetical protein
MKIWNRSETADTAIHLLNRIPLRTILVGVSISIIAFSLTTSAEIYEWKDANGKVHFGDKRYAPKDVKQVDVSNINAADAVTSRHQNDEGTASPSTEEEKLSDFKTPSSKLTCFQESERLRDEGDEYFDIDNITLKKSEHRALNSLKNTTKGKWQGKSREIVCKGTEKSPKEIVKRSTAKVRISQGPSNSLRVNVQRDYIGEKGSRGESLNLFARGSLIEITISGNHITGVEKYRSRTLRGANLRETNIDLQYTENRLSIDITYYINGIYTGKESIQLKR